MQKQLVRVLSFLGVGSRKDCSHLIRKGLVTVNGKVVLKPLDKIETDGVEIEIDGEAIDYREQYFLMLNKPLGYECSARPKSHPSVLELLPENFVNRGIQPAGRLDVETSGLLLLSDVGGFLHHVTSPRRHLVKTYRLQTSEAITEEAVQRLLAGVKLEDEDELIAAKAVERLSENEIKLLVDLGRYHMVRRMMAAVGAHVEKLHREAIGDLKLPDDLEPGDWRELTQEELDMLGYSEP